MSGRDEDDAVATALAEFVSIHDKRWSCLDFGGVAQLWEHQRPLPIYLGDEYPAPLIGADELERHWARVSSRIKSASVSSTLHAFDVVDEAIVRAVVCSRWRLTTRESELERTGASWITWLLVHRGERYRIFHQMESQVYLAGADAAPGR
ncbi:MAG: hypothetical protein JWR32_1107 [Mycobacterium sp.]|nr:hypothetical protein [Mycobacterium sp.]